VSLGNVYPDVKNAVGKRAVILSITSGYDRRDLKEALYAAVTW
jgi:hypothetical protein